VNLEPFAILIACFFLQNTSEDTNAPHKHANMIERQKKSEK